MTVTEYKKEPGSSVMVGKQIPDELLDKMLALDYLSDLVMECDNLKTLAKIHHIRDVLMKK